MSMMGTRDPRVPNSLLGLNQKEEEPDPGRHELPPMRIFFARMMDDQVGELLLVVAALSTFFPAVYFAAKRDIQSLLLL